MAATKPPATPDRLETLRPYIVRLRTAETVLQVAQRQHDIAEAEHAAARQELDDAIVVACKDIR